MSSTCVVPETHVASHIALDALPREESVEQPFANDTSEEFHALEKWNSPRINTYRSFATWYVQDVRPRSDCLGYSNPTQVELLGHGG